MAKNACEWHISWIQLLLRQNSDRILIRIPNSSTKFPQRTWNLFLDQLTHNMTENCSLIYQFNTWKQQDQNKGRTSCAHKLFWMSKQKQKTIFVHNMFSSCSELVVFMYWTGKSMNNLLSYCGLVDARISDSKRKLPVFKDIAWLSQ